MRRVRAMAFAGLILAFPIVLASAGVTSAGDRRAGRGDQGNRMLPIDENRRGSGAMDRFEGRERRGRGDLATRDQRRSLGEPMRGGRDSVARKEKRRKYWRMRDHRDSRARAESQRFEGMRDRGPLAMQRKRMRRTLRILPQVEREALREHWGRLGIEERDHMRRHLRDLGPGDRRMLRDKIERFRALPPDEREDLRDRLHHLRSLETSERDEIHDNAERWRNLDPDDRDRLRSTWHRLRRLSPSEQQRLLDRVLSEAD